MGMMFKIPNCFLFSVNFHTLTYPSPAPDAKTSVYRTVAMDVIQLDPSVRGVPASVSEGVGGVKFAGKGALGP